MISSPILVILKLPHEKISRTHFYGDVVHWLFMDVWLYLEVSQEVSKVNVEQLATLCDHNVVRVTVPYTQHICGNTVASAGNAECLSCLAEPMRKRHTLICTWFYIRTYHNCRLQIHVAVPNRNLILFCCVFWAHHWVWHAIALSF